MNGMIFKNGIIICLFFLFLNGLNAQDIHHSQFFNSPLEINPGLTGVFNGDMRFAATYRRQWKSVPVDYRTFTGHFDMKIPMKKESDNFWSAGFLFDYDKAGELSFQTLRISGSVSYTYAIDKKNLITPGLIVGFNQNRISIGDIRTGNQFENGQLTGEGAEIPNNNSKSYPNFGVGVNYRWQTSSRTHIDAGIGLFNLLTPSQNFYGLAVSEDDLKNRWSITLLGNFKVADKLDLQGHAFFHDQASYREWLFNGMVKLYLNKNSERNIALLLGAGIRPSDAVYPMIGFQHKNIQAAFSYDINYSDFNQATGKKGGPELSVIYKLWKVPKAPYKPCPIY